MVQSLLRECPQFVVANNPTVCIAPFTCVGGTFVVGAAVVINGAVDVVCSRLLVAFVVVDSGVDVVCLALRRGCVCTFLSPFLPVWKWDSSLVRLL